MTPAQRKWLLRANKLGVIEPSGTKGYARNNWTRMMERLVKEGLVTPYVHGGYEITAAGQAALETTT